NRSRPERPSSRTLRALRPRPRMSSPSTSSMPSPATSSRSRSASAARRRSSRPSCSRTPCPTPSSTCPPSRRRTSPARTRPPPTRTPPTGPPRPTADPGLQPTRRTEGAAHIVCAAPSAFSTVPGPAGLPVDPRPRRRITLGSGLELVAETAHRGEQSRLRGIDLDLRPQTFDMDVEGLRIADIVLAPDAVDELSAGHHSSGVAHEDLEQLELLERHGQLLTADGHDMAFDVDAHSPGLEHGLVVDFLGLDIATQHRTHTRQKLTRGVGLRHIVIGAEFESHDLVDLRVLGREH